MQDLNLSCVNTWFIVHFSLCSAALADCQGPQCLFCDSEGLGQIMAKKEVHYYVLVRSNNAKCESYF